MRSLAARAKTPPRLNGPIHEYPVDIDPTCMRRIDSYSTPNQNFQLSGETGYSNNEGTTQPVIKLTSSYYSIQIIYTLIVREKVD